jgi:hypothetical protein
MGLHRRRNSRRWCWYGGSLCGDDLLHNRKMTIPWMEVLRLKQQAVDLLQTDPRIRVDDRCHIDPIGPGLRHEGIRLQLIE